MTRTRQGRSRRQRGFTLLELLVALTLLGFMVTMVFSSLRLGTRAWEAADRREREVYLVQQLLRDRLSTAYIPAESGFATGTGPGGPEAIFEGEPDYLSFIAPLPDLFGVGGLYRVRLEVVAGAGSDTLVMSWRLWRPGGEEPVDTELDERSRRVLLDGIEAGEFAFFGPPASGPARAGWQDSWRDRYDLPLLVRIGVEHPEMAWPPLLVAPAMADVGVLAQ